MYKILLFLIFFSLNVFSTNYYVSPSGSDAASGAIGTPWQHVAHGTATIHAGDTLWLNSGTYAESMLNITNSGTSGSPIVIKAAHGATPIIQGDTTATQGTIVPIWRVGYSNACAYVVFDSLQMYKCRMFMMLFGENYPISNIIIKNCRLTHVKVPVQDNSSLIDFNQGGGTELGCQIINNYFEADTNWTNAIMCWANAADIIVSHNEFSYCGYGLYYKFGLHGVGAKHPLFKNNYVHNMYSAAVECLTDSMLIKNNLIINTSINMADNVPSSCDEAWGQYDSAVHNTVIDNTNYNFGFGNTIGNSVGGYAVGGCSGADHNIITNNVFYEGHQIITLMPYQSLDTSHTTFTYNVAFTDSTASPFLDAGTNYSIANIPSSVTHSNNLQSRPTFQAGGYGYRLASSSPGYQAASDGLDMGANMDSVGIQSGVTVQDTLYLIAGTGGTVLPSSPQIVSAGSIVAISATATTGYSFKNWTRKNTTGVFGDSTLSSTNFTVNGNDTITANFTAIPPPSVSSIIPDSTSVQGGKKIAINGTNFTGTTVKIGSTGYFNATSQTMTSVGSTIDTITTTAFSRGLYKIYVTSGGGTDSSKTIYFYKASLIFTPYSRTENQNSPSPGYLASDSVAGDPWDSIGYKTVLPTGLSLNHSTGAITGTPTVVQSATVYVFYAWKYGYKNDSATVTITVATAMVFYDSSVTWQLSTNNFSTTVLNVTTTDTNYTVSTPLAYNTTYQFRVRNSNIDTNSVWSDTTTFTTMLMPVPDSIISVYPSVARIDALSTKAQRTIIVKEHGPNKCTVNTVIWLGTVPLGFNTSYTDSTVTDTLFKYPTMPIGTFRVFLTDPAWVPSTISDTLLIAIRLLNPSIIVTKP
jgi:hypothetical protein